MSKRAAAALLLALSALSGLEARGGHEKPGDNRFDVTDRVEELRLPITTRPVTVSLWIPLPPAAGVANLAELPLYREAVRRTGVTVAFVHPKPGSEAAALSALVASGSAPDIVSVDWKRAPGGPSAAIAGELIIPLNEVIQAWMPTYRDLLARWPARTRSLRTDEGHYYAFPVLAWSAADPGLAAAIGATAGLQARGDLLEKARITSLDTLEQWDAALRLLKKEGGVDTPLLLRLPSLALTHVFASARGASFGFFHTDGRVLYGPLEPGFRDFLALLASWVKDGVANADFGAIDLPTHDARVVDSKAAVWIQDSDGLQRLAAALRAREPAAKVVALPPPQALIAVGDTWGGIIGDRALALTSKNSKLKVSALWIDTWYSEEGRLLQQRGLPGGTRGLPPLVGHFDAEAWRSRSPAAADAARAWSRAATAEHALPQLSPMGREAALEAEVLPRAEAVVAEMTVKLGTGAEPLDRYGSYAKRLEELGIRELIAAKQAQLDRTLHR